MPSIRIRQPPTWRYTGAKAARRGGIAQAMWTHYRLCSLALATSALDERTIATRLCSEYTLAEQGRSDWAGVLVWWYGHA